MTKWLIICHYFGDTPASPHWIELKEFKDPGEAVDYATEFEGNLGTCFAVRVNEILKVLNKEALHGNV